VPWKIIKRSGSRPYKIVKITTGEVVGSSETKEEAEASVRARYAAEGGMGNKRKQRKQY